MNKIVIFEGPEGAGKSSQVKALAEVLEARGERVTIVKNPGTTELGKAVRSLLVQRDTPFPAAVESQALLMLASIYDTYKSVVVPAFKRGDWVLCDRWIDTTVIFQGMGKTNLVELISNTYRTMMFIGYSDSTLLSKEAFYKALTVIYFNNLTPEIIASRIVNRDDNNYLDHEPSDIMKKKIAAYQNQSLSNFPHGYDATLVNRLNIDASQSCETVKDLIHSFIFEKEMPL